MFNTTSIKPSTLSLTNLTKTHNDNLHNKLHDLHNTINNLQADNHKIWGELSTCKKACEVASSIPASQALVAELAWDGAPNPCIIKGHCKDMISRVAFAQATAEWLGRWGMKLEQDYDVLGNPKHSVE